MTSVHADISVAEPESINLLESSSVSDDSDNSSASSLNSSHRSNVLDRKRDRFSALGITTITASSDNEISDSDVDDKSRRVEGNFTTLSHK